MSSSWKNFENFVIPLEEIHLATQNFSSENRIGDGGFGMVYKGKLSERWQNRAAAIKRLNRDGYQGKHEFFNELELVSSCHHHNIIPFIGYCNEGDEMIIVIEYAVKGSLETHLQDLNKRRCLTWEQRLKICLGTARGLQYLHSGGDYFKSIIHRDLKSANILLDENLEAKICDFGLSRSIQRNDPNSKFYTKVAGTKVYIDPAYERSRKLSKEADVYSFGIVMLELMTGMLAHHERRIEDKEQKIMISLVLEYQGNRAYKITDPYIRDEIDDEFFMTFYELANECVNMDPRQRPTMDTIITKTEEYLQKVQLRREQQELDAERMEVLAHLEKIADKVTQEKHNVDELLKQRHSIQSSFTVTNTKVPGSQGESSNNPNKEGASDSKSKKKWFNLNLKGSSDKKSS